MGARINDTVTAEAVFGIGCKDQDPLWLKKAIRKQLRVIDEQQCLRRGKWYNLPYGIDQDLVERILYYKGCGVFFYCEAANKFMFLPFANSGPIDVYGRFHKVKPLPFTGSTEDLVDQKFKAVLDDIELEIMYDVQIEDLTEEDLTTKGVIIYDYARQLSQTILPRQQLSESIIDLESDMLPYCRTALMNSTGIKGMRVNGKDEASNVKAMSKSINNAALTGDPWAAVIGNVDFQDLTSGSVAHSEEFLLAFQSIDNFRQAFHGIGSGDVYEKNGYRNLAQTQQGYGSSTLINDDTTYQRQWACTIINSIWPIGIWYQPSETMTGTDINMDATVGEDDTQQMQQEVTTDDTAE